MACVGGGLRFPSASGCYWLTISVHPRLSCACTSWIQLRSDSSMKRKDTY